MVYLLLIHDKRSGSCAQNESSTVHYCGLTSGIRMGEGKEQGKEGKGKRREKKEREER